MESLKYFLLGPPPGVTGSVLFGVDFSVKTEYIQFQPRETGLPSVFGDRSGCLSHPEIFLPMP